jgi:restriction system protein
VIPDFQAIMFPLLKHLEDGQERSNTETLEALAHHFHLSESERSQLLPSGQQPVFTNRVAWAKAHLKAAGLLESPRRGVYKITPRGKEVVAVNPGKVDLSLLRKYPEYQEFRKPRQPSQNVLGASTAEDSAEEDEMTPQEYLEYGYQRLRDELAAELLQRVRQSPPAFFEKLVIDLLIAMGYGASRQEAGQRLGRAGDGGVDGVIKEDRLGLDVIYIQAKRWEGPVGRPEIQRFAGALQGQRAKKGVFLTTSEFTRDAEGYVSQIDSKIVLIGGRQLAELMIDHGVGVTKLASYQVSRIDSDYFEPE